MVPDWQQALGSGTFSSRQVVEIVRKRSEFKKSDYPPLTAEQQTSADALSALVDAFAKLIAK